MAGLATDFKIYDEMFFGGMVEQIEQNANAFNAAAANAIQLVPNRIKGNYERESFFQLIGNLVTRRDNSVMTAATDLKMTQGEMVGVKVNRKIGPVVQTRDAFRKVSMDPMEMSFILGQQIGKAVAVDYINTALGAICAAIGGVAALKVDASAGTLSHTQLVNAMAAFGDASARIVAFVMHSKTYFDLMKQSIADKIYEVSGVTIYNGTVASFNRPVIVLDSPSLVVTGTPNKYNILALVSNAAEVAESEEREIISQDVTGNENLAIRIQGEYAFNLEIKGYAWNMTGGGANPTNTALNTASNWPQVATDIKSTAGVLLLTQ